MGADFLVTYVEVPVRYTQSNGLTADAIRSFVNDLYYFVENKVDLENDYSYFTFIDYEDLDKSALLCAIDDFKTSVIDDFNTMSNRESAIIYVNGAFAFVAGGFSYGDSPSDAFNAFCVVHEISYAMERIKR